MNRKILALAMLIMFIPFALVGCGSQLSAQDLIEKAMKASEKLDSYQFDGKIELGVDIDADPNDPSQLLAAQMIEKIKLDLNGVYQREPAQLEVNLDAALGDSGLSLKVPLIVAEDKLWVQFPALPIPQLSPDLVGKYIEIDLEDLQDEPLLDESPVGLETLDIEMQQKLGMELIRIFTKHYDEDSYFTIQNAEEAGLSEKIDAEHVVSFTLKEEQVEEAVLTLINDVLPDVHELFSKPEWSEAIGISEDELDELAEAIEEAQKEGEESIKELAEQLKLKNFEITLALNKDSHVTYQKLDVAIEVKESTSDRWSAISLLLEMQLDNINKEQQFKHGIPTEEDTISFEQLLPLLMGPSF